jgi:REP element-mobilizing transposase RayT
MPNHVHGILVLGKAAKEDRDEADRDGATVPTEAMSLSTIIQRFTTFTAHEYGKGVAAEGWPHYPGRLWQRRFHDHVVHHERELAAIREYIANNPAQWELDGENPEHRWNSARCGPGQPR